MRRDGHLRAFALLASLVAIPAQAQPVQLKIIVNSANKAGFLRKDQVAVLFLNQNTRWTDGMAGSPVDQSTRSAIREAFSEQVLGKSVAAIQAYWQQHLLKAHEMPPPVKSTDEDVIAFVARNRGGIGYVAAETALPSTVRVLDVE